VKVNDGACRNTTLMRNMRDGVLCRMNLPGLRDALHPRPRGYQQPRMTREEKSTGSTKEERMEVRESSMDCDFPSKVTFMVDCRTAI
jgi:hypothetical protein